MAAPCRNSQSELFTGLVFEVMALFSVAGSGITVASATALPATPLRAAYIVPWSQPVPGQLPSLFDLDISSTTTTAITGAELLFGKLIALVNADDTADAVDTTDNEFDMASHGLQTGDGPFRISASTTMPAGLTAGVDYWVIGVNSGSVSWATSFANALAGTEVDITSAGAGTITVADTADTKRIFWRGVGELGYDADGVISLTATRGYSARVELSAGVVAIAVAATVSAGTVTATVYPVLDA